MQNVDLVDNFLEFYSYSPLRVSQNIFSALKNKFQEIQINGAWQPKLGNYTFNSNDIIGAFKISDLNFSSKGLNIIIAYNDLPCLRLKPQPIREHEDYLALAIEPYHKTLLPFWFDRELSIAGKVYWIDENNDIITSSIDFEKPIAVILSSLQSTNSMNETIAILDHNITAKEKNFLDAIIINKIDKTYVGKSKVKKILNFNLALYPVNKAQTLGNSNSLIVGPRVDQLAINYACLNAILESEQQENQLFFFIKSEVEELSSVHSANFSIEKFLKEITQSDINFYNTLSRSKALIINSMPTNNTPYQEQRAHQSLPILNSGPIIVLNTAKPFSNSGITSSIFQKVCLDKKVPYQFFSFSDKEQKLGFDNFTKFGLKTLNITIAALSSESIYSAIGNQDVKFITDTLTYFLETSNNHN